MRTFSPKDIGRVKIKFEDGPLVQPKLSAPKITGPVDPLAGLEARIAKAEKSLEKGEKEDLAPLLKELRELSASLRALAEAEAKPRSKEQWSFSIQRDDLGYIARIKATRL